MAKEAARPGPNLTDLRPSPIPDRLPFDLKLLYLEACGRTIPPTVRTFGEFWESLLVDGLLRRLLERVRTLGLEAFSQGRPWQDFSDWSVQATRRLWKTYRVDVESSGDRIGATRRLLSAIQAMTLPDTPRRTTEHLAREQKRRQDTQRALHAATAKATDLEKKLKAIMESGARKAVQRQRRSGPAGRREPFPT